MKKTERGVSHGTACLIFKYLLMMKLTLAFIFIFCIQAFSNGYGQENISLKVENVQLKKVLKTIEERSQFRFVYKDETLPRNQLVSLHVKDASLEEVMGLVLKNTDLKYRRINEKLVVITEAAPAIEGNTPELAITISGKVSDAGGEPLANVSIVEKGTNNGTRTGIDGSFSITLTTGNAVLVISYVGYITQEIAVGDKTTVNVQLQLLNPELQQVIVVGYGTQRKVTVTGAVSAIKAEKLVKSPAVDMPTHWQAVCPVW